MANVLAELGTRSLAIVRSLFRLGECHRRRSVQLPPRKNLPAPDTCKQFTKSAQSSGPENIGRERRHPGLLAQRPVLSPSRITLENNGKIRPQPDRENAFARASGGGDGSGIQRSLANKSVLSCGIQPQERRRSITGAFELVHPARRVLNDSWARERAAVIPCRPKPNGRSSIR